MQSEYNHVYETTWNLSMGGRKLKENQRAPKRRELVTYTVDSSSPVLASRSESSLSSLLKKQKILVKACPH